MALMSVSSTNLASLIIKLVEMSTANYIALKIYNNGDNTAPCGMLVFIVLVMDLQLFNFI